MIRQFSRLKTMNVFLGGGSDFFAQCLPHRSSQDSLVRVTRTPTRGASSSVLMSRMLPRSRASMIDQMPIRLRARNAGRTSGMSVLENFVKNRWSRGKISGFFSGSCYGAIPGSSLDRALPVFATAIFRFALHSSHQMNLGGEPTWSVDRIAEARDLRKFSSGYFDALIT